MTAPSAVVDARDQPVLDVRDAHKSFGSRQALRGISVSLRQGEILALLGPNGAGKTTLVRSICGRLELDSGSVRVLGHEPRTSPEARRRLGLVPQEIALYPDLTVRENLEILGRLAGVTRDAIGDAADRALDWTGLGERSGNRSGELSGGMRRRLNLAAGTLHEPALLLLDEPTVGVDPRAREDIHDLLRQLRERGMAILLTTHDLDQASELADRIAIQTEGVLRAEGSLDELVRASFGDAREVRVTLAATPDDSGSSLLGDAGLEPVSEDRRAWSGPLLGGLESLAEIGTRLAAAGLATEELRVREPGLRGVFFKLTGRELDG
jgi:ABC-2 type transport system ATP-binding protein